MNNYQKLIFVGNLGKDPETRTTNSGKTMTSFSLAVSSPLKDGDGYPTVWLDIVAFNGTAEACATYLHKGSKVLVEGQLTQVRAYTRKNGEPGAAVSILADKVQFLDPRQKDQAVDGDDALLDDTPF